MRGFAPESSDSIYARVPTSAFIIQQAVLLKNEPISTAPDASDKDRKFVLDTTKTGTIGNSADGTLEMASFFDAYDDGFLDILVMSSTNGESPMKIDSYQNELGIDATWIKAMVYTGFCGDLSGMGIE